jgi:hypothetical protein
MWKIRLGGGVPFRDTLPVTTPPEVTTISSYPQLTDGSPRIKLPKKTTAIIQQFNNLERIG